MVKHIVMWKLKETAEGYTKDQNAERIKFALEELMKHIPQIQRLEAGINQNSSEAAFDVVLYSEFADWESLEIYQKHPKHEQYKKFIAPLRCERVVADYEI